MLLAAVALSGALGGSASAQKLDLGALEVRMLELSRQGKSHEAIPLAEQFLRAVE